MFIYFLYKMFAFYNVLPFASDVKFLCFEIRNIKKEPCRWHRLLSGCQKSRWVFMIVDLAAPEDREAGAVRHQLNWQMLRKVRFWLLQQLSPFHLNPSKLQLHERLLWPFETVRFSCYSPPHSVGPLFCSASSNVER